MGRLGIAIVLAAVLGFVGWQIWRVHSAVHTAFYQRPYRTSQFKKALSAFEQRAGSDASLFNLRLRPGGAFFESLEPEGIRDYRINENGEVLAVVKLSSNRNLTDVFPVGRVQADAPQRIFDAIAADTGHREYLMEATLDLSQGGKLRWRARVGKLGFGSGEYEALPDGTISKRPHEQDVSTYANCLKKAGRDDAKAKACRKLLPQPEVVGAASPRKRKYAKCVGGTHSIQRIRRCQRLYEPEWIALIRCQGKAKTQAASQRCSAAFDRAYQKP